MSELLRDGGAPHPEDDAKLVVTIVTLLVCLAILVEGTRALLARLGGAT